MSTNYLGGAVPAGCEPEDARIIRMPIGANPEDDHVFQRHVAGGWTMGDRWRDASDPRFKVVCMYPPQPSD